VVNAEKAIARKAFARALERELEEVIRKAKEMASRLQQPSDVWDLEYYLTGTRQAAAALLKSPLSEPGRLFGGGFWCLGILRSAISIALFKQ
jgi:hypothetical protein